MTLRTAVSLLLGAVARRVTHRTRPPVGWLLRLPRPPAGATALVQSVSRGAMSQGGEHPEVGIDETGADLGCSHGEVLRAPTAAKPSRRARHG